MSQKKMLRSVILQTSFQQDKRKKCMMVKTLRRSSHDGRKRSKPKPDLNISIPIRMSGCICKMPITRITSHPGNEVRYHQWEETLEKPRRLYWQKSLQGLKACDSAGEPLRTFDLANTLRNLVSQHPSKWPRGVLEGVPHASPTSASARSSDLAAMTPGAGLGTPLLLHRPFPVTEEDITKQERKVKLARERLAMALIADRLASEAEKESSTGGRPETANAGQEKGAQRTWNTALH
ncbi:methyl-CpG-binding domain protein 3-like 1 isoform X3 [Manis pentadactyla]|uniref:methyl-CpG-binding domain protein 3-like 1 isoform X3 n=2 Tax=Manis pentadactyla TaxID=143292 RepID=UPI00255C4636|nr:methyl-CpG-binding domain protein 3-like 1 isoform X3 [Manis pentadactyla]XP_057345836.1 methyl-CpG-binding domain protein 3-like 1 isoform X3 [Manis pentadactyla]XP_057345837.1 methyl-CpG-binding domain protein 3-like 1 isoform X3 [Manis pentadactyla]